MTAINGQVCSNSKVATGLVAGAGNMILLTVQRDVGEQVFATLVRGGKSLGLVMDARNAVVELVSDSAAMAHGGILIGDRILSINNVKVSPGENIVSLFPPGARAPDTATAALVWVGALSVSLSPPPSRSGHHPRRRAGRRLPPLP